MDELHLELARLHRLPRLHGNQLRGVQQPVLLQFQLDEPGGEPGAVDGHVHLLQYIGDGADVVLVAMGDEQAPQPLVVLQQIADVGDDAVDAVHIIAGEGHAAVHHDDFAAVLIGGHVLADLVETAKGDNFHFFSHKYSFFRAAGKKGITPPRARRHPAALYRRQMRSFALFLPRMLLSARQTRRHGPCIM